MGRTSKAILISGLSALIVASAYYIVNMMVGLESSFAVATWIFIATMFTSYYATKMLD